MLYINANKILKDKGKTVYWLAHECGVSAYNMGNICNGKTLRITFEVLEKICNALECTPNDIIETDNPDLKHRLEYYTSKLSTN